MSTLSRVVQKEDRVVQKEDLDCRWHSHNRGCGIELICTSTSSTLRSAIFLSPLHTCVQIPPLGIDFTVPSSERQVQPISLADREPFGFSAPKSRPQPVEWLEKMGTSHMRFLLGPWISTRKPYPLRSIDRLATVVMD